MEMAVVRWRGWGVYVPPESVVFLQTRKEIEALHARVVESARRTTCDGFREWAVRAGI